MPNNKRQGSWLNTFARRKQVSYSDKHVITTPTVLQNTDVSNKTRNNNQFSEMSHWKLDLKKIFWDRFLWKFGFKWVDDSQITTIKKSQDRQFKHKNPFMFWQYQNSVSYTHLTLPTKLEV